MGLSARPLTIGARKLALSYRQRQPFACLYCKMSLKPRCSRCMKICSVVCQSTRTMLAQDLRYFVPLPPGALEKGKESSVPGKLELLKVRDVACLKDTRSRGTQNASLHIILLLTRGWPETKCGLATCVAVYVVAFR